MNENIIAIVGDWHANTSWAVRTINALSSFGVKKIIHTGDFGYWQNNSYFINLVHNELQEHNMMLWWVDGNHDNHDLLKTKSLNQEGRREITPLIHHLPRGYVWLENDEFAWMSFGGAVSLDRDYRVKGTSWFENEEITREDMRIAKSQVMDIKVMVCHDAPFNTATLRNRYVGKTYPNHDLLLSSHLNQERVEKIMLYHKPDYLYHGHHHYRYQENVHGTTVIGLDCDNSSLSANCILVSSNGQRILFDN